MDRRPADEEAGRKRHLDRRIVALEHVERARLAVYRPVALRLDLGKCVENVVGPVRQESVGVLVRGYAHHLLDVIDLQHRCGCGAPLEPPHAERPKVGLLRPLVELGHVQKMEIPSKARVPVLAPLVYAVHDRRNRLAGAGIFLLRPRSHLAPFTANMHLDGCFVEVGLAPSVAPSGNRIGTADAIGPHVHAGLFRNKRCRQTAPVDLLLLCFDRTGDDGLAAVGRAPNDGNSVGAAINLRKRDRLLKPVKSIRQHHLHATKARLHRILAHQRTHLLLGLRNRVRPRFHIDYGCRGHRNGH